MTSASELFYNRRSRLGRSSDPFADGSDFGSHPSNRRHRSHANHARRDRLDPDGCDPLRRPHHHPRQPPLHRSYFPPPAPNERELTRLDDSAHQFSSGNVSHVNVRDRVGGSGNDRLPGAVLLARERLLQRLRGVTLSSGRRSNRNSSGIHHNEIALGDDFRLVDAGDWETEISREWLASIVPFNNITDQQTTKRPPGLTQEALGRLCVEVFSVPEENHERDPSRAIRECSICLEGFSEGEKLIRLSCWHRYHFCCLEPWVRTCGDCPYCRRDINVNLHRAGEDSEC